MGSASQHPGALEWHLVVAEVVKVFLGIQEFVHQGGQTPLGDQDRKGDPLAITVSWAPQRPVYQLFNHLNITICTIEIVTEFAGEQQAAHEVAPGDLVAA